MDEDHDPFRFDEATMPLPVAGIRVGATVTASTLTPCVLLVVTLSEEIPAMDAGDDLPIKLDPDLATTIATQLFAAAVEARRGELD